MKFYVLDAFPKKLQARTDFLKIEPFNAAEAPKCEFCGRYTGSVIWLPPYRVSLETFGKGFGDLAFGTGDDILISKNFKDIFLQNKLSGLEGFDPVEIVGIKRHRPFNSAPPQYYRAAIARSKAAIDDAKSELERGNRESDPLPVCPHCRLGGMIKRTKRIILEPDTWSGEDIFRARGLRATIITSEKFKSICEAYHIKNAILIPAEEYNFDFYPWEK